MSDIKKTLSMRPRQISYSFFSFLIASTLLFIAALSYSNSTEIVIIQLVFSLFCCLVFIGIFKGKQYCKFIMYFLQGIAIIGGTAVAMSNTIVACLIVIISLAAIVFLFQMKSLIWFKACKLIRKGENEKAEEALLSIAPKLTDDEIKNYQIKYENMPRSLNRGKWVLLGLFIINALTIAYELYQNVSLHLNLPDIFYALCISSVINIIAFFEIAMKRSWGTVNFLVVSLYFNIGWFALSSILIALNAAKLQQHIPYMTLSLFLSAFAISFLQLFLLNNKRSRSWLQAARMLELSQKNGVLSHVGRS